MTTNTAILREYSGWLQISATAEELQTIIRLGEEHGVSIGGSTSELEIEYAGRDTGRKVALLLLTIAPILVDAQGEIKCETHDDRDLDPGFEFFTIRGGRLLVQAGHIVRDKTQEFDL